MIKTLVTAGAVAAGANIPLTVYTQTNNKAVLIASGADANKIKINALGIYDIKANVIFTPTAAGTTTLQLYADGVAISGAEASVTATAGNTYTFNINDVVKAIQAYGSSYAKLYLQFNAAGTVVNGDAIVEYVQ